MLTKRHSAVAAPKNEGGVKRGINAFNYYLGFKSLQTIKTKR